MAIVEIIPFLYPINGAERLVINLIKSFVVSGNKVVLISLYSRKDNVSIKELEGLDNLEIYFLDKKRGIDYKCSKKLKKLISQINPDVVHCHLDSLTTIWLSRIYKKHKTYFTFHTLISESVIGNKHKFKNILYRHILKKKLVSPIAISKTIQQSICDYYNIPESSVDIVYNGVPTNQFTNTNSYGKRNFDFIFIGRFIDLKNPLTIVAAFNNVVKDYKDAKLVMIGEGPLLEECKKTANKNITFTGFISDVSSYLKDSKALILASNYEGNPMVINEAIASRCYVIATKVGGIPDVVNDKNGLLFDLNNDLEQNLAQKMKVFLADYKNIDQMLMTNYKQNKEQISIDRVASDYLKVFMRD